MLRECPLKFTRELATALLVRSVNEQGATIGDRTWSKIVAITHQEVIEDWCQKDLTDMVEGDFEPLFEMSPEVILYGSGRQSALPPRDLMFAMARRGIGFEVMDTSAAARTFNVLAGEGRPVAAILTPLTFKTNRAQ